MRRFLNRRSVLYHVVAINNAINTTIFHRGCVNRALNDINIFEANNVTLNHIINRVR